VLRAGHALPTKRASLRRRNIPTRKETGASRSKILAAYAAIYLIWGSTYLGIRFAIETIPPFLMGGVRFMLAGAALYLWMRARGAPAPSLIQWRSTAIVGGFLILGGNGGVVWAEQFVPSGMTALLVAILPFWMVLIDWMRPDGTRPGRGVIAGLMLGLVGLVTLIGPSALAPSADSAEAARSGNGVVLVGAIVLILASLSWALGSIYSRHAPLPKSAFVATGMEMFCGGALLFLLAIVTGEHTQIDLAGISTRSMLAFVYLTTIGSLVGFTAYIWLLKVEPASRVSTYAYVNPVVAVFLGWALAGEALSLRTAVASAIIIGAVAVITTARSSSPSQAEE
jgi:drug/metabolite transporter (DMT)-like permease